VGDCYTFTSPELVVTLQSLNTHPARAIIII
jgi:hypothetical protein